MNTDIDDLLNDAFQRTSDADLKPGFHQRVLLAMEKKKKRAKLIFTLLVGFGAAIILGMTGYFVVLYQTELTASAGIVQAIIGFGILLFVLQILDKKLVKDRMVQNLRKGK